MRRTALRHLFAALLAGAISLPALAADVALVVVNTSYRDLEPLEVGRAGEIVSEGLAAQGFKVTVVRNATTGALLSALRRLGREQDPEAVAVVYYLGYARQLDGKIYLMARNAEPAQPFDFVTQGVQLESVMRALGAAGGRAQLAVIDGAYAEPRLDALPGLEPGLPSLEPKADTVVLLGAPPGRTLATPDVAGAEALSGAVPEAIAEPGASLDRIALRVAALAERDGGRRVHATLGEGAERRFVGGALPTEETAPPPVEQPAVEQPPVEPLPLPEIAEPPEPGEPATADPALAAEEQAADDTVLESGVRPPAAEDTAAPAPLSPAELEASLSEDERRAVQQALSTLGLYTAGIDGEFGPLTRRGITTFQRLRGFDATGVLSAAQMSLLFQLAAE